MLTTLACRTHNHSGCVGAEQDDCEIVTIPAEDQVEHGSLSDPDRLALRNIVAAQTLRNALPSWESLPLLSEFEHAVLVDRIRGLAHELAEAAGTRGVDLWKICQ